MQTTEPGRVRHAFVLESHKPFVFQDGDLVCEKVYFDHATVLRQLGVAA